MLKGLSGLENHTLLGNSELTEESPAQDPHLSSRVERGYKEGLWRTQHVYALHGQSIGF